MLNAFLVKNVVLCESCKVIEEFALMMIRKRRVTKVEFLSSV